MAVSRTDSTDRLGGLGGMMLSRPPGSGIGPSRAAQLPAVGITGAFLGLWVLGALYLMPEWAYLLVPAALLPFVALAVGNLRRLLLGIAIMDIPFHFGLQLDYRERLAALGAIGGLEISPTTLSLAVLYALWLAEALARTRPRQRLVVRVSLPLALYVAFASLSAVHARDVTVAGFEALVLCQSFLLFVYVASAVRTRQDMAFLMAMLAAGLLLESLVMVGTQLMGQSVTVAGFTSRVDLAAGGAGRFHRVGGTVGGPNGAAAYISLLLAPCAGLLLSGAGTGHRRLAAAALALGTVALLFTFSRGGWIAAGLSMAMLCAAAWRRGWLSMAVPVAGATGVALLAALFWDTILARLSDDAAAAGRLPLIQLAFAMIRDNPILGVGANNFTVAMKEYLVPELARAWLYAVHNKLLLIWAESGTPALAAYLLFLATTLVGGWRLWKSGDRFVAAIGLGLTAAIVGHLSHMLVDIFNDRPSVQLLWLLAALIAAMGRLEEK